MSALTAVPDDIDAYGQSAALAATHIAAAGGADLAAHLAALAPVFGPIGADFLAKFGAVQAEHALSVGHLAAHYAATAAAAHACAAVPKFL